MDKKPEFHGSDLEQIEAYYHIPKEEIVSFGANVNPLGLSEQLKKDLASHLDVITRYPDRDYRSLKKAISKYTGVSADHIVIGNGSTELISLLISTRTPKKALVLGPTYSEYARELSLNGGSMDFYNLKKEQDFQLDIDDFITTLKTDYQLAIICNPNNPTGEVRNKEDLKALVDSHPDKLFIFDQSYEYFTLKSLLGIKEAASFPNVILLHSMTKQYAIPGLRVGYFTASEGLTDDVRCRRMPWSVNSLAIEAAKYLLEEGDGISADIPQLLAERERLTNLLLATGMLEIWPTDTHYMLIKLRMGKAAALKDFVAVNHGILIRDASNFEGLDERFFRIATQTPEENDKLVKAISEWMEQIMS